MLSSFKTKKKDDVKNKELDNNLTDSFETLKRNFEMLQIELLHTKDKLENLSKENIVLNDELNSKNSQILKLNRTIKELTIEANQKKDKLLKPQILEQKKEKTSNNNNKNLANIELSDKTLNLKSLSLIQIKEYLSDKTFFENSFKNKHINQNIMIIKLLYHNIKSCLVFSKYLKYYLKK